MARVTKKEIRRRCADKDPLALDLRDYWAREKGYLSVLADYAKTVGTLRGELERRIRLQPVDEYGPMTQMDYRGNRSTESEVAYAALGGEEVCDE